MKFINLKIYRGNDDAKEAVNYLRFDLAGSLRDLTTGLGRLRLEDNFEGFITIVNFLGSDEVAIRHNLGFVPSQRIILRADSSDIVDGLNAWDENFVYLRKENPGTATVKVAFLR